MKPSEILDSAANIILRDGWHQGDFYKIPNPYTNAEEEEEANRTGPCCQDGALQRAVWGRAWHSGRHCKPEFPAYWEAREYMDRHLGQDPIYWNDHLASTREEVVEALRSAAELARSEGR